MAETARMTDRFKDGPSPEARAGIKDAARLLRQGVRQAGSRLLGSDTPLPGLRPSGQQPLRRSIEEAAKAADRLITRAETGLRAALLPQDHAGIAAMPPEPLRVVLLGEASEQVANAVTRMMRQWLKAALADLGEKDALVLERPLHLAMRRHRSDQRPPTAADGGARLFLLLLAENPVRMAGPGRGAPVRRDPQQLLQRALAAVILSMAAAASRKSKAAIDAAAMLRAARVLLTDADGEEASALAGRFEELSALL